jgi:Fic family protein
VAAFGFVYIHPLADGNGRVHRFLVNDLLRRDGAVPEPMILPVSALIAGSAAERRDLCRCRRHVNPTCRRFFRSKT